MQIEPVYLALTRLAQANFDMPNIIFNFVDMTWQTFCPQQAWLVYMRFINVLQHSKILSIYKTVYQSHRSGGIRSIFIFFSFQMVNQKRVILFHCQVEMATSYVKQIYSLCLRVVHGYEDPSVNVNMRQYESTTSVTIIYKGFELQTQCES